MSSAPAAAPRFERMRAANATNTVFKSGPLFISSKGIGWKSWKKRWFILTRTSLVFFKNDPSALPQRGGEVNITLGGIDLNNSGSVLAREDKKLLTVLFPDGRDGRAFTLKAETAEDLFQWKTALVHALAQAPNAALVMGHNGIFRNETTGTFEASVQQWRDRRSVKALVVGRPILLALEDIDGGPSFLEKALRFIEKFGIKVEGILRQSADVEEVDCRVRQYEQGRTEFADDEDAHVVGDCIKNVLRELPSSPVPASCCSALLDAYKLKESRVSAMRSAISETFPEPNQRLFQRILKMMHTIACHTTETRMTASSVAACMAPLLLRPLLAGECEADDDFDFDVDGDNSAQLLAAVNAANNAQAIVTTLIEDYENIFDDLRTGMTIALDRERNELYYLDDSPISHGLATSSVPLLQWHCRLGHLPLQNLKSMGCVNEFVSSLQCESYELGKNHRASFPSRQNKNNASFDLVHVTFGALIVLLLFLGLVIFLC